ncbi:MAG: ribosome maturation factor RimM [Anaerolineae bacterium]
MSTEPKFLVIGEVLKPWGYQGEIKVKVLTDFPKRLEKIRTVYLGEEARAVQVERARLHSGFALFKFAGYETEESVAKLRGQVVQVAREDAAPLKKGQYFHYQIIGLETVTLEGELLGRVEEILETGANDVYLVRRVDGSELLLPAIKDVIREIDLENGRLVVSLLPGLA